VYDGGLWHGVCAWIAPTFYHVLPRGNERKAIFRDDADRVHFLDLLGLVSQRLTIEVWGCVPQGNLYHLILRMAEVNLSQAMHWLSVAYSPYSPDDALADLRRPVRGRERPLPLRDVWVYVAAMSG